MSKVNDLSDILKNASSETRELNAHLLQNDGKPKREKYATLHKVEVESVHGAAETRSAVTWNDDLVTITLHGERPLSMNDYYTGMHFTKRAQEARRVKELVQLALFESGFGGKRPLSFQACIEIICYMVHPAYDTNNASTKSYVDALQGFVITGDDLRYVRAVLPVVVKVQADPRVVMKIGRLPWECHLP